MAAALPGRSKSITVLVVGETIGWGIYISCPTFRRTWPSTDEARSGRRGADGERILFCVVMVVRLVCSFLCKFN